MIAAEAPILFSKACEMFVEELTVRAWAQTVDNKRRTMHRTDVGVGISNAHLFDFLVAHLRVDSATDSAGRRTVNE